MAKSSIGILIVDDYEPFRRFVCSTLRKRLEFQVISEVSDGLEGVQKASELQPDLIILDIGLPKLNGIEAARQIRKVSPRSRILFVSQETSADIVEEVFSLGACGYVFKTDAGSELLTAVDTVLRGERFIGSRFATYNFTGGIDIQGSQAGSRIVRPTSQHKIEIARRHEAAFYSDDASFLDGFGQFIHGVLIAGSAVVLVATESHRDALFARLKANGLDIDAAVKQGRYISLDVIETLSTFMDAELPDPVKFSNVTNDLVDRAAKAAAKGQRVGACGECAPLLCEQRNFDAALRVEQLWDDLARKRQVDILCGYSLASFQGEEGRGNLQRISEQHSAVPSR